MPGKILLVEEWDRRMVDSNPEWVVLFGDNLLHTGHGGQASIRGAINAYGVPTKRAPTREDDAYFNDQEYDENCAAILLSILSLPIDDLISGERTLVLPAHGLGTGRANLQLAAPLTWEYLQSTIRALCFLVVGKTL